MIECHCNRFHKQEGIMKKIVVVALLLLVSIGIAKEVKADSNDQMENFLERYALTGEQLDSFENQSTLLQRAKKEVIFPSLQEYEEYVNLNTENNSKTILSYDEYTDFMNPSEPTTKVENDYRRANYVPVPGDILITNGTSSSDFVGHAGIFLGNGTILSIEGYWKKPSAIGIFEWASKYMNDHGEWTKIYKAPSNSPSKAEQWGINNIKGKDIDYGVSGSILNLNPTYCSKIVYQCYWNANNNNMVLPSFILPYALPNVFLNGTSHVATWSY